MKKLDVSSKSLFRIALVLLAIRLISLGCYPLLDKTESRYGEIGRVMAETNNWITPQLEPRVPFWGKPPLSFWATAIALKSGLVHAFTARLPHFIFGLFCLWAVWIFAIRIGTREKAILAFALLASSIPFLIIVGGVMTDGALLLSVTLSLVGFYLAQQNEIHTNKRYGYLFFIGIGLGLLSKGPVALILIGIPIILWMIWSRAIGST